MREKLEASVLSQESLCSKDLMESPKSLSPTLAGSPILDSTNERQRELAAKVITAVLAVYSHQFTHQAKGFKVI